MLLRNTSIRLALLVTLALLLLGGVTSAGNLGRCYSATLPADAVLPDGSRYAAGTLKICLDRELSPVAALNATYFDGMPVGLFRARMRTAEAGPEVDTPFFLFLRNARGQLELQGYAVPEGGRLCTFHMAAGSQAWDDFEVSSRWELLAAARPSGDGAPLVIFAD